MNSLNFDWTLLLGAGVIGNLYSNEHLDIAVVYSTKGTLLKIQSDEKFQDRE